MGWSWVLRIIDLRLVLQREGVCGPDVDVDVDVDADADEDEHDELDKMTCLRTAPTGVQFLTGFGVVYPTPTILEVYTDIMASGGCVFRRNGTAMSAITVMLPELLRVGDCLRL